MVGPYNITPVDIGGAISNWQNGQLRRQQQMLAQRQFEREEREADRQNSIRQVLARAYGGGETSSQSPASKPRTSGNIDLNTRPVVNNPDGTISTIRSISVGMPEGEVLIPTISDDGRQLNDDEAVEQYRRTGRHLGIFRTPEEATAAAERLSAQQGRNYGASATAQPDRQQIFRDLLALDPDTAFETMRAFGQMDEQQFQRTTRANGVLAREAYRLQQLPPEQRRAALRQAAPQLTQMGLTPEQIDGFDPTDENLSVIINQATDIDDLARRAQPDWMNVEGELIDRNAIARGENPVRWRSEYMNGPGGIYRRPNAGLAGQGQREQEPVRVSTPEEARRLPPGTPIILPDGSPGVVPGGPQASNPAGGF